MPADPYSDYDAAQLAEQVAWDAYRAAAVGSDLSQVLLDEWLRSVQRSDLAWSAVQSTLREQYCEALVADSFWLRR